MKRFALAVVLTCIFTQIALAGDIPAVPAPPPPPLTEGDMGAGGFAETITDEIALAIFDMFAR